MFIRYNAKHQYIKKGINPQRECIAYVINGKEFINYTKAIGCEVFCILYRYADISLEIYKDETRYYFGYNFIIYAGNNIKRYIYNDISWYICNETDYSNMLQNVMTDRKLLYSEKLNILVNNHQVKKEAKDRHNELYSIQLLKQTRGPNVKHTTSNAVCWLNGIIIVLW